MNVSEKEVLIKDEESLELKEVKTSKNYEYMPAVLTIIGIYVCYITSTVMQEALYEYRSNDNNVIYGDRFESYSLLLFIKSFINFMFSNVMTKAGSVKTVTVHGKVAN